jgi:hypothetical protein
MLIQPPAAPPTFLAVKVPRIIPDPDMHASGSACNPVVREMASHLVPTTPGGLHGWHRIGGDVLDDFVQRDINLDFGVLSERAQLP